MYCPECGNDAGSAKFCPECGANLSGVKDAISGKPAAGEAPSKQSAKQSPKPAPAPAKGGGRISPAIIWGAFGAIAVVVLVVVVIASGGFGGKSGGGTSSSSGATTVNAVSADTSGSYDQLVARANSLYDQGDQQFQSQNLEQGSAYFAAAAKVYAAALKKKGTDPAVGTDYSVALFYSGNIPGAIKQVDSVLAVNPDFQKAWLNKGIFISHEARLAEQNGDKATAKQKYAEARQALTKAVALDAKSAAGKQADSYLQQLPK